MEISFTHSGVVHRFSGENGWYFLELNHEISNEIRSLHSITKKVAWGYIPVTVTVGKTTWDTTIFPTKNKTYFIALKADIRKKEHIVEGKDITIEIHVHTYET